MFPIAVKQPRHDAAMWFFNNCVQIPNMFSGLDNFSIIAVIQTNTPNSYGRIISFRDFTVGTFFEIFLYTSKLAFYSGGLYPTGATTIARLTPTIIGITVSQRRIVTYYINGQRDYQGIFSITWRNLPGSIGAMYPSGTAFNGVIRDVVFFERTLSEAEMLTPYTQAPMLAFYEGTGTLLTNWQDTSGNGYHATGIIGTAEQCLIHRRGAVIRTDGNNNRYIVT